MKLILLLTAVLTITTGLHSCAETRSMKQKEKENTESFTNQEESVLFATISKGYCYGKCPVYEMKIYTDGKVVLEGKANIDYIGTWEKSITKSELEAFVTMAEKIGYMELEDRYDSSITDVPSTTTSIVINGVRKEVYRRANYPEKILQFEALFTQLLDSKDWKKVGE